MHSKTTDGPAGVAAYLQPAPREGKVPAEGSHPPGVDIRAIQSRAGTSRPLQEGLGYLAGQQPEQSQAGRKDYFCGGQLVPRVFFILMITGQTRRRSSVGIGLIHQPCKLWQHGAGFCSRAAWDRVRSLARK